MAGVLSNRERFAQRSHPELQKLNEEDFAALKGRLTLLGYYDPADKGKNGAAPPSIAQAYETFKKEIAAGPSPQESGTRQDYIRQVAAAYKQPGQDRLDTTGMSPKIINDIARAAVADAGGTNAHGVYERDKSGIQRLQRIDVKEDYGYKLRDKIDGLIEKYKTGALDSDGIAQLQGALRSSRHQLKIDGKDGAKTKAAIADYTERKGAYFTAEERTGVSGWDQNTGLPDGRPIADGQNDFTGWAAHLKDDGALYVDRMKDDTPKLALDGTPHPLNKTQIQMMQGVLNIAGKGMDPQINLSIDGKDGSMTREALQRFWKEKDLPMAPGMTFDKLNSHHFETLRFWATANRPELLTKSTEAINAQIAAGEVKTDLQNKGYNDSVAAVQGTLSMLGHETSIDGRYGGQTAKNLMEEPGKYNRDPDVDYRREAPSSTAAKPAVGLP